MKPFTRGQENVKKKDRKVDRRDSKAIIKEQTGPRSRPEHLPQCHSIPMTFQVTGKSERGLDKTEVTDE